MDFIRLLQSVLGQIDAVVAYYSLVHSDFFSINSYFVYFLVDRIQENIAVVCFLVLKFGNQVTRIVLPTTLKVQHQVVIGIANVGSSLTGLNCGYVRFEIT